MTVPGVGPIISSAVVAAISNGAGFKQGRDFGLDRARAEAALEWGKNRLGSISKQGDLYLRGLFAAGALAVIRYAKIHGTKHRPWLTAFIGAEADQGRRHSARQQDRTDGLGHDGQG